MNRIKQLRVEHEQSQHELAAALETTQQTVARWEAEQVEPSLDALTKMAEMWDSSIDYLLGRDIPNRPWSRDELILALDLYMANPTSPPAKAGAEVAELSGFLNRLGAHLGYDRRAKFRNPNGVYMKLMNFRRLDPAFIAAGKIGLTRGNKDEEVVWNTFAHDRGRLAAVAEAIRTTVKLAPIARFDFGDDEETMEAEEGRVLTRLHRTRERSRELVERRKLKAIEQSGRLRCEACEFDFQERYGERGRGWIEAHHTKPVCVLAQGEKTSLVDLALVCANCHRMIHSARPWLTVEQLRQLLQTR